MAKIEISTATGKAADVILKVDDKEIKNVNEINFFLYAWMDTVDFSYAQRKEQSGDFSTYVRKTYNPATASFTEKEERVSLEMAKGAYKQIR